MFLIIALRHSFNNNVEANVICVPCQASPRLELNPLLLIFYR